MREAHYDITLRLGRDIRLYMLYRTKPNYHTKGRTTWNFSIQGLRLEQLCSELEASQASREIWLALICMNDSPEADSYICFLSSKEISALCLCNDEDPPAAITVYLEPRKKMFRVYSTRNCPGREAGNPDKPIIVSRGRINNLSSDSESSSE
jgi:hypothetical protein